MGMANWSGRATLFTQLVLGSFPVAAVYCRKWIWCGWPETSWRHGERSLSHWLLCFPYSGNEKAVVEDGVDLIGYTPWGCIDLVSAGTGEMKKRYGMIYVDKDNEGKGTLERIRKASFYWYRDLIANNGENIWDFRKILRRYQALWSEPDNNYIACWL